MRAVVSKAEIESEIASRFSSAFQKHERRQGEVISTGIQEIDSLTSGGLPRGAITEIYGPASSGRTSFMLSALSHATNHDEVCALVDTSNAFAPQTASDAAINCDRLLWVRCDHNLEHAFKAADLLLQGGGFGLVALDLGDVPANSAKRIISSWWYRFRRTLELTPTSLVVIAEASCVRSCAALALELRNETCLWSSSEVVTKAKPQLALSPAKRFQAPPHRIDSLPHTTLFKGFAFQVECRRPLYFNNRAEEIVAQWQ
jgi:recombination protein RecA